MFDIENAIALWRAGIAAAGMKSVEALDELEAHLREDMDRQIAAGVDPRQAFEMASQRIGPPRSVTAEFGKVRRNTRGRRRPAKALIAVLLVCVLAWLSPAAPRTAIMLLALIVSAALIKQRGVSNFISRFRAIPDPSSFTSIARLTLEMAREEARRFGHNFIGTEHLLLAVLRLEDGPVPKLLRSLGLERDALRKNIEERMNSFPSCEIKYRLRLTPRLKRALRLAAKEAKAIKQFHAGPEYLVLGLLVEGDGVAARALKDLGADPARMRQEIPRLPA